MTPSQWTGSVRALRDTPMADYSSPSCNSTCRIPALSLIAVSLFVLVLSVSKFKRSHWRCGQLSPYVGMGSLRTGLCRDCNAMGDAVAVSPRVSTTCTPNAILSLIIIHMIRSCQICVSIDNPSHVLSISCLTTSSYLWNDVGAAYNVSHAENMQNNGCWCFSHLYKFRDGIQVT